MAAGAIEGNRPPDVESVRTDDRGRWDDDGGNSQVRGVSGYRPDAEGRPDLPGPRAVGPRGEPMGSQRALEDERLRAAVSDVLARCDDLAGQAIECRCERGAITLTGCVSDVRCKRLAREVAGRVDGVREVHDRLAVAEGAVTGG